ncbi:NAD-binding protein [Favolaschia claudopus]|uniref:NAD-binding protein n=1 Tax=Favolaschia claudopus TaxID=2862362 RepID=A0AAW0DRL1_9AGAR
MSVSDENLVDLRGKVVIVTGGNTGIGYATIQMLARKGAKVYMGARSEERALAAIKNLQAENINDGSVHWLKLDLSDPRAAKRAAQEFLGKETRLDILGVSALGPFKLDKDGLLDIMVTNHLSPFAFTDTLLPLMKETAKESGSDVRIVNVSSRAHERLKPETLATPESINHYYGDTINGNLLSYGLTKLANILHIKELQKRLIAESIPITCIAVDPGTVKTAGSDEWLASIPYFGWLLKNYIGPLVFKPWRNGAMPVSFAAAGKDVAAQREKYQGVYIAPMASISQPNSAALDERLQRECYETSQTIIAALS